MKNKGDIIIYAGGCDVIRTNSFKWYEFRDDNKELIIDKEYTILGIHGMQSVFIKKEGNFIKDSSGERYYYYKILNEQNEEIYVWSGFFK